MNKCGKPTNIYIYTLVIWGWFAAHKNGDFDVTIIVFTTLIK